MYVPGYHETSGGETVPNILNVELCSKTCYFNPSCVAFHYVNRNCVTYSSTQGGPRLFLYLWLKAKRQMEVGRQTVLLKACCLQFLIFKTDFFLLKFAWFFFSAR